MQDSDILSVASRRRIHECVQANPGAHLRDLARRCGLPLGTTLYHLDYMESTGLIVSRRDGRYKRYFLAHAIGRREKDILSLLRHDAPRRIVYVLLRRGASTQRELCQAIGVSRSTLSFHVNRLVQEGAVLRESARPENLYRLAEPELALSIFERYEQSLSPDDAERFGARRVPLQPPPAPPAPPRLAAVEG